MSKRFAIVSVGTNSTRLLLADVAPAIPRTQTARSVGTRLGEGLGEQGRLGDEPMQRTLEAIGQFQREVKGHYIGFLRWRPARCGERRTVRSSRSESKPCSALRCASSPEKTKRKPPIEER